MNKIRYLLQKDIDLISAGEVILDLQSVVKELLDNAIDAGATEIYVNIYNKFSVIVSDNGSGMKVNDLELCSHQYTTSKFSDLHSIITLGFRGEALYSISKVSKMLITTRHSDDLHASCLDCSNGTILTTAGNIGTVVHVRDLFKNYPVRQKFLQNRDNNIIRKLLQKYVVCYSNINFTLKMYNSNVVKYSIGSIFKNNELYNFSDSNDTYSINGYIIKTTEQKYFIFVNKRIIFNQKIHNTIVNAWRKISMKKDISYVIFINVPSYYIDVNVHPQKSDVRFLDDGIFEFIYDSIVKHLQICHKNSIKQLEFHHIEYLSLLYNRYILATSSSGLLIIDAHAAHERIVTEGLKNNKYELQKLLFPIVIDLTIEQQEKLVHKKLKSIFSYSIFNDSLVIDGIINILAYAEDDLVDMIHSVLNSENDTMETILHDFLHNYGCLNSLRHHNFLSANDCNRILKEIFKCENGGFCNHGRKTFITITLSDLDNKFER